MAFDPATGLEARVATGGGSTALSGAFEWRIQKTMRPVAMNHFELTADADGVVWETFENGLASATCTVRGLYNTDTTDKTESGTPGVRVGQTVTLDLLFSRTPFGYLNLSALCTGFEAGAQLTATEGSSYTASFTIKGAAAAATA
jgi:hypothetical protein